jgi:prepilin-type N-terminal cleavage/methylation domain-containing protein
MNRRAFTLIELVMVIILIGILSVTTTAVIAYAIRAIQLSGAADKVASDLRYAANMASATATWYGVSFETDPVNRYTIYTTTGTIDTVAENPAKRQSTFVVDLGTDFSVAISSVEITGGKKVEFSPLGMPFTDRTGLLVSPEGVITLSKSSSIKTVRIVPNTGRIYIQ